MQALETFPPIAIGDEQDYDIDFTAYVTGSSEAVTDAHTVDDVTAQTGITITSTNVYNGTSLDGVPSCFVRVKVTATTQGTFAIAARILTEGGLKHTAVVKVKVQEAL